jgi:uncharacterized RDD family membrane protein YckC
MTWYYANAGKQLGPITDAEFDHLRREGVIRPDTLVWCEGMEQWASLETVAPSLAIPSDAPALASAPHSAVASVGTVVCSQCRKLVAPEETMQFGSAIICSACKPTYLQKLREGAVVAQSLPYAGFWIRVAAYVIDQVILAIVTMPLSLWFNVRMQAAIMGGQFDWPQFIQYLGLSMAWSTVITVSYGWLFVGRYAATPGKMIVKIKIVTGDGGRVSYLRALARQGGHIVSGMTCMIGYLLPLFDDQKRALHDYICNTRVVYK